MTEGGSIVILILMLYFLLFIFELVLLFFLSRRLIHSLAQIIYRITKSHHAMVNILAIIFLPGTLVHELAHLLFAGVMLVPVGDMTLLPEIEDLPAGRQEMEVKLGSVEIGKTDPFRRTIIGVAPVLFGILLILVSLYFVRSENSLVWWQVAIALYLVFEIGNTMFSSRKDLEGVIGFAAGVILVAAIVLVLLYFLTPSFLQNVWTWLNSLNLEGLATFFKMAGIYLIVPVVLDLLIILLTRPFVRRN